MSRNRGLAAMVSALPDLSSVPHRSEPVTPPPTVVDEVHRDTEDSENAGAVAEPEKAAAAITQLDHEEAPGGDDVPPPAAVRRMAAEEPAPPAQPARRPKAAPVAVPEPEKQAGPRYLQFEPKTVRMTAGQFDALQRLERTLRRKAGRRQRGDELITANALVRMGIDLVLREADSLSGTTEAELRASIGLEPLDF